MSHALLRTPAVRLVEAEFIGKTQPPLMERAGAAAAALAEQLLSGTSGAVLVLAGSGNNGGDGYVVARLLRDKGISVELATPGGAAPQAADAANAHAAWLAAGGSVLAELPSTKDYALAIDGLFGIGLTRNVEPPLTEWIAFLNALPCKVLALDIPSGLNADNGSVMGVAVKADHTITFLTDKPGLHTLDGQDHAGEVHVAALGLNVTAPATEGTLLSPDNFRTLLSPRPNNTHKGSFGSLGIIGGAPGMAGAALLAGRAALKLGAGRVYVGMLDSLAVDPMQPELMMHDVAETTALATALVVGPGLGQSGAALNALRAAIAHPVPLLLDADALNLVALHPVLAGNIARRSAPVVITPHPAEAARLLDSDTGAIQADRIGSALKLAKRFNATTVLKGCGSVIALPDGRWFINATGNAGLATAGTGDVLSGLCGALLAQGAAPEPALLAAVYLHGAAADALAAAGNGPIGIAASELIEPARRLWNSWVKQLPLP